MDLEWQIFSENFVFLNLKVFIEVEIIFSFDNWLRSTKSKVKIFKEQKRFQIVYTIDHILTCHDSPWANFYEKVKTKVYSFEFNIKMLLKPLSFAGIIFVNFESLSNMRTMCSSFSVLLPANKLSARNLQIPLQTIKTY